MSRWYHTACPKCSSSDAFSYKDDDEFGFCFSCQKSNLINQKEKPMTKMIYANALNLDEVKSYDTRGFKERGITKPVAEHYGVKVAYAEDGTIESHFYPYTKDNVVCAYKERKLPKDFLIHGDFKNVELFGQNIAGSGKRLIITEGELDALAMAQAQYDKYSRFYPVVAIPSASATSIILAQRDWIRNFDEVVLMFDNDEAGRKATETAAKIIGYERVKIANLPEKDPCEVLIKHGSVTLMSCMFDARPFSPAGVVKGNDIWEQYQRKQNTVSLAYPICLKPLNEKLYGMRMGDIVLFTSGTGAGKSTISKEIILEILDKTTDMVGIVSLEESVGDTAEKFIGMQLKKNLNREKVSEEEKYEAFTKVFGDERLVMLDHQGSVSDESLADKMEHLALMGCKYIFLDHITIAVSEGVQGKTGNEAIDSFMSDMLKITKKHNIWLGIISHLRKSGVGMKPFEEGKLPSLDDIKGSGSIKQISFDIVAFSRNMIAETESERNTIKLRVLKSRFTGLTGDCGSTRYDTATGRLTQNTVIDFE